MDSAASRHHHADARPAGILRPWHGSSPNNPVPRHRSTRWSPADHRAAGSASATTPRLGARNADHPGVIDLADHATKRALSGVTEQVRSMSMEDSTDA
jgi:hypothetical protein